MTQRPVTTDAFRFLSVRAPKPDTTKTFAHVIVRSILVFAETEQEKALAAIPRGIEKDKAATYAAELKKVLGAFDAARARLKLSDLLSIAGGGGVVASFSERGSLDPEAFADQLFAAYKAARGSRTDEEFLLKPLSRVWDEYVLVSGKQLLGLDASASYSDRLLDALRFGASLTCLLREDGSHDASRASALASAAVHVPLTLIDAGLVRRAQIEEKPQPANSERLAQNEHLRRLLQLEVAALDLRGVALNGFASVVGSTAGISNDDGTNASVLTPSTRLALSIPLASVSESTRKLLAEEWSIAVKDKALESVPIGEVLASIDAQLLERGNFIFVGTSVPTIATVTDELRLLQSEVSSGKQVSDDALATLPLLPAFASAASAKTQAVASTAGVRSLGIGDLKVVKQTLVRYERGEVAYIENILKGQTKERTHSIKTRTEETLITVVEESSTSEKDLQSTDRFEVADETSAALSEKQQNEFGVTVSASYGAVSMSAHTQSSDEASQEESAKHSQTFAKEVIAKSIERVQKSVRTERVRKTTTDLEETNKYILQASMQQSIVGLYRWVDKSYWAEIRVYGNRLMLEFMVPEPAAAYIFTESNKPTVNAKYSKPEPLTILASQITRTNYMALAAKYAAEVQEPPPLVQRSIYKGLTNESQPKTTTVALDEGWVGTYASAMANWTFTTGASHGIKVLLGNAIWGSDNLSWGWQSLHTNTTGEVPLQINSWGLQGFAVSGTVLALPSSALFERWQLNTYKAILAAYRLREAEYDDYENARKPMDTGIRSKTDSESRAIEQRELQRACISILSAQQLDSFGSIVTNSTTGWPEIDFPKAADQGAQAAFFQQSFEWEQMTYVFYPYYWSRQSEWIKSLNIQTGDSLFAKFLSSGFARVVVPVRPGHEGDALYFLESGKIWSGTTPPVLGDPRYVDIVNEIKEMLGAPDDGVSDGTTPWRFKVPTSLVVLDDGSPLPEWPEPTPPPTPFIPSTKTCDGVPYNLAQWPDAASVVKAIGALGYELVSDASPEVALKRSRKVVKAMQARFNELGAAAVHGRTLAVDGVVGACTLRALTYFTGLLQKNEWPGP